MSNHGKPTFSLGTKPPAPLAPPPIPGAALPANVAELIAKYPLPWCVGPEGYIWVAADVVKITDPDDRRVGDTSDGWRATGNVARLVLEHKLPADRAAAILYAVNRLADKR